MPAGLFSQHLRAGPRPSSGCGCFGEFWWSGEVGEISARRPPGVQTALRGMVIGDEWAIVPARWPRSGPQWAGMGEV